MKILDIYDNKSDLRCHGKNIFRTIEAYLATLPEEYRKCYLENIETLHFFKFDELVDDDAIARYITKTNNIIFTKDYALGHELFHVASEDRINKKTALNNPLGIENGLVEGMTEYLHMKAYNLPDATTYFFETFCVMMLEDIPELFKSYFIPTDDKFFKLFPNVRDIYNLLYAIDIYCDRYPSYSLSVVNKNKDFKLGAIIQKAYREVINQLIELELSFDKTSYEYNIYGEKLIDLLNNGGLKKTIDMTYPSGIDYAVQEVKKRIKDKR